MSSNEQNYTNQIATNHGNYLKEQFDVVYNYFDEKSSIKDPDFNFHTFLQTDPKFLEIIEQTIQKIETFLESFHEYTYHKTPESFTTNFEFTQSLSRILHMIKSYSPQLTSSFQDTIYEAHIKLLNNPSIDFSESIPNLWEIDPYHQYADISGMNLLTWWIFNDIPIVLIKQLLKKEPSLVNCVFSAHVSNYSKITYNEYYRLKRDDIIVTYEANICDFIENRSDYGVNIDDSLTKEYLELFAEYGMENKCKEEEIIQKINSVFT